MASIFNVYGADSILVEVVQGGALYGTQYTVRQILDGATYNGKPIYRRGTQCGALYCGRANNCPYAAAIDYSTDNGQTWAEDITCCDALADVLPLCPIARAVKAGKTTWRRLRSLPQFNS